MKQLYVYIFLAIIGLFFKAEKAVAQQIIVDETTDEIAGSPIFSHGIGYAGTVIYEGEEIPWFVLSDVYVDVPHPGDTIVTQSFPVAGGNDTATRTYPMGSEEYESVMSRMRPAFRMFFPQYKCGGKVKKGQEGATIESYYNPNPVNE